MVPFVPSVILDGTGMSTFPMTLLLAPLVGLAFAGTLVATVGLLTHEELGFDLFFRSGQRAWMALPLLVLIGPLLLLRALGPRAGEPPVPLRFALPAYVIVLGWSVASGHLLLRMIGWVSALLMLAA